MTKISDSDTFIEVLEMAAKLLAMEAVRRRQEEWNTIGKDATESVYHLNSAVRCKMLAERYGSKTSS